MKTKNRLGLRLEADKCEIIKGFILPCAKELDSYPKSESDNVANFPNF